MLKKIAATFLCLAVLLSMNACGSIHTLEKPNEDTDTSVSTEPSEVNTTSDSFGLTLDEIVQLLKDSNVLEDFVTYDTPQYTVHRTGSGTDGALLFSSLGSDKIEVAFFLSYSKASRQSDDTEAAIYAQDLLCEYCDNNGIKYKKEEIEQEYYLVFAVYALDSTLDNLPLSIRQIRSENEFFASNERAEMFTELMSTCKYQELKNYIDAFILEGICPENDTSHHLTAKLDEIIPLMEDCYVEVDNIEKITKIFHEGANGITRNTNVFPSVEPSNYGAFLNISLGFVRNDWLFFDRIYFASDSTETENFSFNDTITDILSGGVIFESVSIGTSAKNALMEICKNSSPVIRFKNSDTEEYIDHKLTSEEIDAILQLGCIRDLHDEIWDCLSEWENA